MNAEFREAVRSALKDEIDRREIDVTTAARLLRVSRQVMHRYLNGAALPSIEVLYRACDLWKLRISYRGVEFGACSLEDAGQSAAAPPEDRQTSFSFEEVDARDFAVRITSQSERHVDLQLSLRVGR